LSLAPIDDQNDIAQLAQGGRTNVIGFLLRLAGRIPFLIIGGRMYGAVALGRMAYAVLIIEFAAQIATNGMRRGLAQQFARGDRREVNEAFNALLISLMLALPLITVLHIVPQIMFPHSRADGWDLLLPLVIIPIAWSDILLAALAYRFDVATTVRARSIVEPWTISFAALAFFFVSREDGLIAAYVLAMCAAFAVAFVAFLKSYGLPRGWRLEPRWLGATAWRNLPLSAADAIEWASRRIDLAILGLFMIPEVVGVYYVAQQVASLPQRLKMSFDPVLGPVIARKLAAGDRKGVAAQIGQVGFWIIAAQLGIALAFGWTSSGVMGLIGPKSEFVRGTRALCFLMGAEVVAAIAVVSESALVYVAPKRNMLISALMIALQIALTFAVMALAPGWGWSLRWQSAAPAMMLCATLLLSSVLKAQLASEILGAPVRVLRWPLLVAGLAASLIGAVLLQSVEWVDLAVGIPAIAGVYAAVIWRFGFAPADRALFTPTRLDPKVTHQH
jgi:O-antigen/teichoic acid export membrane protein